MGGITDSLFGGSKQEVSNQQTSGFRALPADIQKQYRGLLDLGEQLTLNPEQYYAPMDLTSGEQLAGQMIQPDQFQANIEQYLNPYRDIVAEDITRQFGGEFDALSQQADVAGAFGGSRYREGLADVERARADAIARATADQYGQAAGLSQQGIQNLLGFGQLERGVDLQQRQALPAALGQYSSMLSPLLGGSTGTGYTYQPTQGLVSQVGQIAGLASGIGGMFSDRRLKTSIKKVGESNGLNEYEYEYIWSPKKVIGYMADEVEKIYPDAVSEALGYKVVDYGMING